MVTYAEMLMRILLVVTNATHTTKPTRTDSDFSSDSDSDSNSTPPPPSQSDSDSPPCRMPNSIVNPSKMPFLQTAA